MTEIDWKLIHQILAEYCFRFQPPTVRRAKIVAQADLIKENHLNG